MQERPLFPLDVPATYRICVIGSLESSWSERLWGIKSSAVDQTGEPQQTMLLGEVADQAALVGIINALYNAGHTVVSVERMPPNTDIYLNQKDISNHNDTEGSACCHYHK